MIERGNSSVSRFSVGFAQAVQEFQAKMPIMLIDAPPCNNCTLTVQVSDVPLPSPGSTHYMGTSELLELSALCESFC